MIGEAEKFDIILSPLVTEKSTMQSEFGKVMFKVARSASKPEIKQAVEKIFGVKVTAVNTINRKGKTRFLRGRRGKQPDVKLAIVTLKEGDRIDISSPVS